MKKVYIICEIKERKFMPESPDYGKIQLNLFQVYETEDQNKAKDVMKARIEASPGKKKRYCIIEEYKLID